MKSTLWVAALLLTTAACRPKTPATGQAPPPTAPGPAARPSAPAGPATATAPPDTLHLPGGQVARLRPVAAAAFNQLPTNPLHEMPNDPAAENLAATQGRVRRQGLDLFLQPAQGGQVRLTSTATEATLQDGGVKYEYWGSLPAAHQWVVRAWYWEVAGTVLVDQRTGRHLLLLGDPVAAPDGRLVLLINSGLSGGDQANALTLVQIAADGPRQLWQREPTTWEPQEARWAAPGRAVLRLRHVNAQGDMPDDAPTTYAELSLPR